jgi:hypothetical protein
MLPLLLIAASAGLNYLNNQEAQKRREKIRGSMEQYQRMKAAETQAATEKLLEQQTPEARRPSSPRSPTSARAPCRTR